MTGMLLNFVPGQVQKKSQQNHITKGYNVFHNYSTLITMVLRNQQQNL